MKHSHHPIFILFTSLIFITANAQTEIDIENTVSDSFVDVFYPINPIREINGGSVFIVDFSEDCSVEMKGAFNYACKILEEYIPTCLPIKVRVEWDNPRGSSSRNLISKITTPIYQGEGNGIQQIRSSHCAKIKNMMLSEFVINSNYSFYDYFNINFLKNKIEPDITISYNKKYAEDFSYSQ